MGAQDNARSEVGHGLPCSKKTLRFPEHVGQHIEFVSRKPGAVLRIARRTNLYNCNLFIKLIVLLTKSSGVNQ